MRSEGGLEEWVMGQIVEAIARPCLFLREIGQVGAEDHHDLCFFFRRDRGGSRETDRELL
jgi:hypothetical protein